MKPFVKDGSSKEDIDDDVEIIESVIDLDTITSRSLPDCFKKTAPQMNSVNRKVNLKTTGDNETLIITQRVAQPKFKCIIHLNANIYHFEQKYSKSKKFTKQQPQSKRSKIRKEFKKLRSNEERIVPVCLRSNICCKNARTRDHNTSHHSINKNKKPKSRKETKSRETTKKEIIIQSRKEIKTKRIQRKSKHEAKKSERQLSSISSFSLSSEENNNCAGHMDSYYEDISENSFNLENEIDLLIKRTKERIKMVKPHSQSNYFEPILSPDFLHVSCATSTPNMFDNDATSTSNMFDEDVISIPNNFEDGAASTPSLHSEMDFSINSLTTVVLHPVMDQETKFQPIPSEYSRIKLQEVSEEKQSELQDQVSISLIKQEEPEVKQENSELEKNSEQQNTKIKDEATINNLKQVKLEGENCLEEINFLDTANDNKIVKNEEYSPTQPMSPKIKNEPYSPSQPVSP